MKKTILIGILYLSGCTTTTDPGSLSNIEREKYLTCQDVWYKYEARNFPRSKMTSYNGRSRLDFCHEFASGNYHVCVLPGGGC